MKKYLLVLLSVCCLCILSACGGGGAPPVGVSLNPPSATVLLGALQAFVANVTGSANIAVTWSVREGAAGGAIDNQGNYTAPQVAGTYHVVATSVADPTKTGSATITVPVAVTVTPNPVPVFVGATQIFTAGVAGTTNMAVTWSVQEGAAGGTIDNQGNYTAPLVVGTYHVIATSVVDPTQSGNATVNVLSAAISVFPLADTLGPGSRRHFGATVTAGNTTVGWTITEGPAGGTIDGNGNYIAPTAQGIFHVVATSVVDTTKSATATVTIVPSGFLPTGGNMTTPRFSHTATLLNTGEALLAGGIASFVLVQTQQGDFCQPVATNKAELFDPATGLFAATTTMTSARSTHTATLLQDGIKVLVAGGSAVTPPTAEIYDPATAAFTLTGNMLSTRQRHTATLLPSGKVLMAGGGGVIAELFDPTTLAFAQTGSMTESRFSHTATLLPTGKVLVAGGLGQSGPVATAELYDPSTGIFTSTGSMATARTNHTATLLPSNGTVLIAGGTDQTGAAGTSAEIYNPATGIFSTTGSMAVAHSKHTATLLPGGKVLIAGGGNYVAELYDPPTGTFSLTGSMFTPRGSHAAALLANGQVVVTGSSSQVIRAQGRCFGGTVASAELFH